MRHPHASARTPPCTTWHSDDGCYSLLLDTSNSVLYYAPARICAQADSEPSFVSSKAERVERFVVVHGQIILNQFKHFPNKAVREAAFCKELRTKVGA
jgi:hypothetical protein